MALAHTGGLGASKFADGSKADTAVRLKIESGVLGLGAARMGGSHLLGLRRCGIYYDKAHRQSILTDRGGFLGGCDRVLLGAQFPGLPELAA